mmetsp:Transcript_80544/g.93969  ORF Transcript_80544/g.93969 Transcript_80544/m.93969 type:complete len:198 (-) Transcript_80544:78-671(-)|eukprot:CAMPEP_0176424098 /NCGR_PEP_ID=MMETSP0127-20121128/10653_1 /TAXON_ID=938130 /ORGANISM="Platyophrya macrostoma, Strain WH" /LENGTH=197 /DNA_ID=CAMNT_0017805127 /DNA_START=29 /DNA_END=622 /DNA_ORIENTATION=+
MSLLSEKFLKELIPLENLDDESLGTALVFGANVLMNKDNSNKLSELIEIDPNDENELVRRMVNLLTFLAKFKLSEKEFRSIIDNTKFSESKKKIIFEVLQNNQDEMRKNLQKLAGDEIPSFRNLNWRFDVQISSKLFNEEVKPKVLYDFELKNSKNETENVVLQSDFATLKHLYEQLNSAIKLNNNTEYQKFSKTFK